MRTFEYRLYPNTAQSHLLMECLKETRIIYNEMLETVKAQYEERGTFPGKYDLTARFKGRGLEHVPATTVQSLADRLSKSLKRFLARKELAVKVGFPRFKKGNQWHSIQLRQYGKDVYLHEEKKHLIVPKKIGHFLKIKWHRPIEGRRKRSTWYCVRMDIGMPSSSAKRNLKRNTFPRRVSILTSALTLVSSPFSRIVRVTPLRTRASIVAHREP